MVTGANILYGCCVGTWGKFQQYVAAPERQIIAMSGYRSISMAYNDILHIARERCDVGMVVLLHDDLEITDPRFEEKMLEAVALPDVAIAGVAGGGPSMSWWNINPIGHQLTDSGMIEFGSRPSYSPHCADVHVVEGSIMAFSPWAIEHLRFDERYEFLGYDDVCLAARLCHKRVVVADVDTHHHSTVGYKSDAVREMWERSEKIWIEKWGAL